jgi:hypothetical protein
LQEAEMNLFGTIPFVKEYRMRFPYAGKGQALGTRRFVLGLGLAALILTCIGPALAAPGDAQLPKRNLLIEWRMNGVTQIQKREMGIRSGQIIVDSRGQVVGRSGIGAGRVETESRANTVQQVQVINGGRARLFVGQTQPHLVWQWAWMDSPLTGGGGRLGVIGPTGAGVPSSSSTSPQEQQQQQQPRPRLAAQTVWIDIGQGLYVRPRWGGGREPVLVDLEAQSRQPVSAGTTYGGRMEPDGQTRNIEVGSTLSVPLGDWVVVARSGAQVERQRSGSLSTRELDGMESEQLEIRITAP